MADEKFNLWNGKVVHDLEELSNALTVMTDEEFVSYVNSSKNDFANWIEYTLLNKEIANKIRNLREKDLINAIIIDFLKKQTSKMMIGSAKSFNDDALVKEIIRKNETFLGIDNSNNHDVPTIDSQNKSNDFQNNSDATNKANGAIVNERMNVKAEQKEINKKESGSKISLIDFTIFDKIKRNRIFFIGLTFGIIMGMLLALILVKIIFG
ncbi:MAG: hypothetical protein WC758_02040 [Candidatus Woesearchaeota archaeon]|jgi:hypothetical protein